jgi:hypothetical protein
VAPGAVILPATIARRITLIPAHSWHSRRRVPHWRAMQSRRWIGRGERICRWLSTHRLMQVDLRIVLQQRSNRDRIVGHFAGVVFPNAGLSHRTLLSCVVARRKEIVGRSVQRIGIAEIGSSFGDTQVRTRTGHVTLLVIRLQPVWSEGATEF